MERIAVTACLRQGTEARARELIEAGPPFDLRALGLVEHSVYLGTGLVVFVFEGKGLRRKLSGLVNDRIYAASFGAWADVLAEQPRLAHETYHWDLKEEPMMKKILIATDGSASAQEAVEFGLELAAEQGAEPIFIHAAPALDTLPVSGFGMGGPAAMPHELSEDDRAPLERATELADQKGLEAKTELVAGNPVNAIASYADAIDADLIVVGSRGHGAITGALLGSVSLGVLRHTRRPVMVVRGSQVPAGVASN